MVADERYIPYSGYQEYPQSEMKKRASDFRQEMQRRRSIRQFSSRQVPIEIIQDCLMAAGSAPSGANMQPWHFVVVSNKEVKKQIRQAAEDEERAFYQQRAPEDWLEALAPLGTNPEKPFLEEAPYLIVIFAQRYGIDENGEHIKHYYVQESVGLATGVLVTALHHAGLASLTYTPSPMEFLRKILNRPENERPFLLLAVGYPAEGVMVPDINRKRLDDLATFV